MLSRRQVTPTDVPPQGEYMVNTVFTADLTRGSYVGYGFYHIKCSDDTDVHCW